MKARAKALIDIAAPQFQEQLREDFKKLYGRDCYS